VVEVAAETSAVLRRQLIAAQHNRDAVVEIDIDAMDPLTLESLCKLVAEMTAPVAPLPPPPPQQQETSSAT
jgi:hypothetical protein